MPHSLQKKPAFEGQLKKFDGLYYICREAKRQLDTFNHIECHGCHLKGAGGVCSEKAFDEMNCKENGQNAIWVGVGA